MIKYLELLGKIPLDLEIEKIPKRRREGDESNQSNDDDPKKRRIETPNPPPNAPSPQLIQTPQLLQPTTSFLQPVPNVAQPPLTQFPTPGPISAPEAPITEIPMDAEPVVEFEVMEITGRQFNEVLKMWQWGVRWNVGMLFS